MKNQYVGDINDYHKYGLLRSLKQATGLDILISWMLTSDDTSKDGGKTEYLKNQINGENSTQYYMTSLNLL